MNSLAIWDPMYFAVLASLIDVSAISGRLE
jgi:hypothetical protein